MTNNEAAEMEAMIAQMRIGGNHKKRQSNMSLSGYNIQELQSKQQSVDLQVEIEDYRAEKVCAFCFVWYPFM